MGVTSQIEGLRGTIREPKVFFEKANNDPKRYIFGAIIITILPWSFSVQTLLVSIFGMFLTASLIFLIGRIAGGRGKYLGILTCVGYANIPSILIMAIFSTSLILGGISLESMAAGNFEIPTAFAKYLAFALVPIIILFVWSVLLYVLLCKECHKTGAWMSIGISILSLILSGIIPQVIVGLI